MQLIKMEEMSLEDDSNWQSNRMLHMFKGRMLLLELDTQTREIQKCYRFLKGEYFKIDQFSMVRVAIGQINRYLQIGWKKKYHVRELIKLRITGLRDENKLEEIVGEMVEVGKIAHSRLRYTTVTNHQMIYIIGGYDEYKRKYLK